MSIFVPELSKRTWLQWADRAAAMEICGAIDAMSKQLDLAAIALELFNRSYAVAEDAARRGVGARSQENIETLERFESEYEANYIRTHGPPPSSEQPWIDYLDRKRADAERRLRAEKLADGSWPSSYCEMTPILFAESLVNSLAPIPRMISQVSRWSGLPEIQQLQSEFDTALPALKAVRDAIQHVDERVHNEAKKNITARDAITDSGIVAAATKPPNRSVFLRVIRRDQTGALSILYPTESGEHLPFPLSPEPVILAQTYVQRLINCFEWTGPDVILPLHR